ncbi:hypothetical protein DPEC_G00050350 [Dallia pectoralis]|uniref:Uncharacterized protein n=1 Tax=Dallia pectoralis TaxID=75939 RepID=A0ACC2HBN9_DALPE|nr:hypothetical protein DPEC_G00050350 [Dallia pectoralis]
MAGDCTYAMHYPDDDTCSPSKHARDVRALGGETATARAKGCGSAGRPSNFELIDGLMYRKKFERGFIHYREVLDEGRRLGAIATFHRRRHGTRHQSMDDTYRSVADNYWWEGMYFHIRDYVLGCQECQEQRNKRPEKHQEEQRLSKTMTTHSRDVLHKLRSQREAGLFCDVTLRTDGCSYSAHKAVLAAVSEYFQEVLTEMDSTHSTKSDIDLTGYSESSLMPLLEFSYSSILCVSEDDLQEVSTMARHLGMWPALEACLALQRDQGNYTQYPTPEPHMLGFAPQSHGSPLDHYHHIQTDRKKMDHCHEMREEVLNRRSPRRRPGLHPPGHSSPTSSPTCRMKLMDFKSPSKKRTPPRKITTPRSRNTSTSPSTHTRLLRSSPGAAQTLQRLLPRTGSPPRGRKPRPLLHPASTSCSPRHKAGSEATMVMVKQEEEEGEEDEKDHFRTLEKYRLMNVLGLQRTSLLPRPEDLIGWRQKKRLRKLKVNNYSLTKRRIPRPQVSASLAFEGLPLSLPLCTPANAHFLTRVIKTEPEDPIRTQVTALKRCRQPRRFPPSDRSMRSKVTIPDLQQPEPRRSYGRRGLGHPVRVDEFSHNHPCLPAFSGNSREALLRDRVTIETVRALRYNSGRQVARAKLERIGRKEVVRTQCKSSEEIRRTGSSEGARGLTEKEHGALGSRNTSPDPLTPLHSPGLYRLIKEEPADPLPVAEPFPAPPSPELGKRQSKPPVKLLDPGFLFSFCRPAGGPMVGVKREEESVDICLTRSVSRGERFGPAGTPARVLRARGGPIPLPKVKKEREQRSVSHSQTKRPPRAVKSQVNAAHSARATGSKAAGTARDIPKKHAKPRPVTTPGPSQLDSIRRARLRQLRGPRSQAPKAKSSHVCLQCQASYKDCYALVTHRIRHIEGKHWPCPLCSKTFFRMRNVKNHIRTHDQKLYKCRSCINAS